MNRRKWRRLERDIRRIQIGVGLWNFRTTRRTDFGRHFISKDGRWFRPTMTYNVPGQPDYGTLVYTGVA